MSRFSAFLNYNGPTITDSMKEQLMTVAREMANSHQQKRSFRTDDMHGSMRTEYQSYSLGFVKGTRFSAIVEHELGITYVGFLASEAELKGPVEGQWSTAVFLSDDDEPSGRWN